MKTIKEFNRITEEILGMNRGNLRYIEGVLRCAIIRREYETHFCNGDNVWKPICKECQTKARIEG